MAVPDFAKARRRLRRARIEDALGVRRIIRPGASRDLLLERLAQAADEPVANFGELSETQVDMLVSLAVTEVDESAESALGVVLMAVQALAADGQFARLALLTHRIRELGTHLNVSRPFLADACAALDQLIRGDDSALLIHMDNTLSHSRLSESVPRHWLADIVAATSVKNAQQGKGPEVFEKALELAERSNDGLVFAFIEAVATYVASARRARVRGVLLESDSTFGAPDLLQYLQDRGMHLFFPAQIQAVKAGITGSASRVIALPTSSGKTFLAELRVAASLHRNPGKRAIYVAPYRLLARQVTASFRTGLTRILNLQVRDLGSAFDPTALEDEFDELPDVAVLTPERLDSLLRLSTSVRQGADRARELLESCQVLIFDELQLLGREGRGPRMELLLARLRERMPDVELLGLAAASQGINQLSQWLTGQDSVTGSRRPTGTLEISWTTDGKLLQRVPGGRSLVGNIPRSSPIDDASLLITTLNDDYRPVLALCTTRPNAERLARRIFEQDPTSGNRWWADLRPEDHLTINRVIEEVESELGHAHPLALQLGHGIAFHHAGIPTHLLRAVENLASRRLLRAVCATTTMAEGADLPFRAVVIPHLNFANSRRRLDRDLYMNIIGRAGRANVALEGLVFILESDAPTLANVVRDTLWNDSGEDRVRSALSDVTITNNIESWDHFYDVQNQVMGWLGDGNSYVDNQSRVLASMTFASASGGASDNEKVERIFDAALSDLEARGFAVAASPYRLTETGSLARLTGLSAPSVSLLRAYLDESDLNWLWNIQGGMLDQNQTEQLGSLLFRSIEVLRHGLWMRRSPGTEMSIVRGLGLQGRSWPETDPNYRADVQLLSAWISGRSLPEIASIAPTAERSNALFGGTDASKLASDAAEYVGKISYNAALTWSAIRVLLGSASEILPSFISESIELGVPTETAARLISRVGLTRSSAVSLSAVLGSEWEQTQGGSVTSQIHPDDLGSLTTMDRERFYRFFGGDPLH